MAASQQIGFGEAEPTDKGDRVACHSRDIVGRLTGRAADTDVVEGDYRMVGGKRIDGGRSESAFARPGQDVALSRLPEILFVEVLRSWITSPDSGEGGWLEAMADPHIGPALQLIHERLDRSWTLGELANRVGLGHSAFSARFTKLVGEPTYRYLIARRRSEAAFFARNKRRWHCTDCEPCRL